MGLMDRASEVFAKSVDAAADLAKQGASVAVDAAKQGADAAQDWARQGADLAGDIAKQASRTGSRAKLRAKLLDAGLEYDRCMKELGTAVYEQLKDDPSYSEAHAALLAKIASVAAKRQELADALSESEAKEDAERPVDVTPIEPSETPSGE